MPPTLHNLIVPWQGDVYRHIPADSRFNVLDFRFAGVSRDNRWNSAGEPTLYLASDRGVVIAEFGRHYVEERDRPPQGRAESRQLYRLRVELERVLDLRVQQAWGALSISGAPAFFLDRARARAIGSFLRTVTPVQAMLVPSVAFLDQPESRWSLVLFLEKLPVDPTRFLTRVEPVDQFVIHPPPT